MITVAGAGPGHPDYLTQEVRDALRQTPKVFAFGRIAKSLGSLREDIVPLRRIDEILEYSFGEEEILILVSGDPTFYSMLSYLGSKGIAVQRVMPGLSSFQYLMAKLQLPWQDAQLVSFHGRPAEIERLVRGELSIALIDAEQGANFISTQLASRGVQGDIIIGYDLSYETECIVTMRIGETIAEPSSLGVVVVYVQHPKQQ